MKKLIAILFLLAYSFGTIGATLHSHYCMGEYVGTSVGHTENKKCGKCGMKENATKKGCCKDEKKEYKIKDDQQKRTLTYDFKFIVATAILPKLFSFTKDELLKVAEYNCSYYPPPNIHSQNLLVLYCTFLI